jgi:hypothetical protein
LLRKLNLYCSYFNQSEKGNKMNATVNKAAVAIKRAMYANKHWHIGTHADGTPALDIDKLQGELIDGSIGGWLGLKAVNACTLGEWSGAMQQVITQEFNKQQQVDRFDYTNKYDR